MTCTLAACALLAGCDGSPSDADIKTAIQNDVQAAERQAFAMIGDDPLAKQAAAALLPKFHDAKKLGCSKDAGGGEAYVCDIEVTVSIGGGQPQTNAAKVRFVKGSNGWTFTKG
ncbi:MAG: hypothetical protein HQL41_07435 [Alphaproteobacteria bacterium]|nr:hypothetical protein [Alphaproteobacteria bacterium]